eukprot:1203068-Prymnesium_polylepis.1
MCIRDRPYAVVSMRELIQVVNHITEDQKQMGEGRMQKGESKDNVELHAWLTYCCRFRDRWTCEDPKEGIEQCFAKLGNDSLRGLSELKSQMAMADVDISQGIVSLGGGRIKLPQVAEREPGAGDHFQRAVSLVHTEIETFLEPKLAKGLVVRSFKNKTEVIATAHVAVLAALMSKDGLKVWGVPVRSSLWWQGWIVKWVSDLDSSTGQSKNPLEFLRIGALEYTRQLRHEQARQAVVKVFQYVLPEKVHIDPSDLKKDLIDASFSDEILLQSRREVFREPPPPNLALTPRFKLGLAQVGRAMRIQLPTLVTGPAGCGKTALVLALAELTQAPFSQTYMTAETEAPLLVGAFAPKNAEVEWQNGVITRAVDEGLWALLDNLADTDSTVLERLNPCLEEEVDWRLVEKGEDHRRPCNPWFRFVATMTIGKGAGSADLSPALYNRFNIIHLPSMAIPERSERTRDPDCEKRFKDEMRVVASCVLGLQSSEADGSKAVDKIAEVCWRLSEAMGSPEIDPTEVQPLTFRLLVRLLDNSFRLSFTRPEMSGKLSRALVLAFKTSIQGLFLNKATGEKMKRSFESIVEDVNKAQDIDRAWGSVQHEDSN